MRPPVKSGLAFVGVEPTRVLPGFRTEWTVRRGVEELCESFKRVGLTREMFSDYVRLTRIQALQRDNRLDAALRWRAPVTV